MTVARTGERRRSSIFNLDIFGRGIFRPGRAMASIQTLIALCPPAVKCFSTIVEIPKQASPSVLI